jgi:hypothetical protein
MGPWCHIFFNVYLVVSCFIVFSDVNLLVNATLQVAADGLVAKILQGKWLVEFDI